MKKSAIFIALVVSLSFLLCSCDVIKDKTQRQLEYLEKEYMQEEPGTFTLGGLNYKGEKHQITSLIEKKENVLPSWTIAYAIHENKLYFSYVCDSNDIEKPNKWVLVQYDLSTKKLKTLYEEKNGVFGLRLFGSERGNGGMLAKDKIYLIMGSNVIIYSIRDNEIKTTTIFELEITENYMTHKENEKFIVNDSNREKYEVSYLELVAKSQAAAKLSNLKKYKIWNGKSAMDEEITFVQPEEQAIFVIDRVLNKGGHSYAVVYAYNPKEDTYEYVNYYYVDDVVNIYDFYVVPIID